MAINDNDIRVKRTKRLIRQGLSELAKTKSLSKISVKELTDLVEINRGTFYLHYKDISDLVESIETELYNEFSAFMNSLTPQNVLENALDLLEQYVSFAHENKDVLTMLMGAHGDAEFVFKLTSLMDEKIYDLCKAFYPNMNHTLFDMASEFGKFGALGLLNCWFTKHPEWTPRQVAEMWLTLMTRGLHGITHKVSEEV
jgi:AcrR family transcriptional regulator